jgi:hypothetical protein
MESSISALVMVKVKPAYSRYVELSTSLTSICDFILGLG